MPMSEIYRYAHHSDLEHQARADGVSAGYSHANIVEAYGPMADTQMPECFATVAQVWAEAYREGIDDFEAVEADEQMYGHDWRG